MAIGFIIASVFLLTAVIIVPLAKKLNLGSVLGYLFSGVLAGKILAFFFFDSHDILDALSHMSEFGVILMLFLIGLEIRPKRLWEMKAEIFGLGSLQVLLTSALIAIAVMALGLSWQASLVIGLSLSLSSTAIAIQSLTEKKWDQSVGGQKSFAALLLQDLAVIPILALLPLLSADPKASASEFSSWRPLVILLAVGTIFVAGRYLINPLFRFIADAKLQELFTTAALGLVTFVAALMSLVDLSPALGVFIAGVVLSESDYRHQLEADIFPFKGLLLGLFFMTIGASFDFEVFGAKPLLIVGLGVGFVVLKTIACLLAGLVFRVGHADRLLFAFALAQGGEFAFVVFGESLAQGVLEASTVATLKIVVAVSMLLSPLLFLAYERWGLALPVVEEKAHDVIDEKHPIIVAGFGRFGQMVVRLLASCGFRATILDFDPRHIETLKPFGWKVYYGDASRIDLLRAAGIAEARLLIVAIDDPEKTLKLVETVRQHYPDLPMVVRARNRVGTYELMDLGVEHIFRETFEASMAAGEQVLRLLGFRAYQAHRARMKFAAGDRANIKHLYRVRVEDREHYFDKTLESEQQLAQLLQAEFTPSSKDKRPK